RGAAPIQRAIMTGDAETGITIMQMEEGLDTGPLLAKSRTPIDGKTAGELTSELAQTGARLIVEVLGKFDAFARAPQPHDGVTYAAKITKEEARLDFTAGAMQAERQVRAFNPAPGAFFLIEGERFRVLAAEVVSLLGEPGMVIDDRLTIGFGKDCLRPTLIQRAGKGAMGVEELLRGFAIPAGTRLDP
ncbi:MAG: methionyl-tRNA formyltransferase, partial [Sphingobium sp.]